MPEPFCVTEPPSANAWAFVAAVKERDAARVRVLLAGDEALRAQVDACWFSFDAPAIVAAKHDRAVVEVLLEFGADINKRSEWPPGGFGVLDDVDDATAEFLIGKGAVVGVHAAAWLRDLDRVKALVEADPSLVHARGGDGKLPLHYARTEEVMDYLLARGAHLEARDLDHDATAAQYAVGEDDAKCRYLIGRGAVVDIFMAMALGDRALVETVLAREPGALATTRGACPHTTPGHIYIWRLEGAEMPLEVARTFGHEALYLEFYPRAPAAARFAAACWYADGKEARALLAADPALERDATMVARAAWERRLDAVRLLLDLGFDPHVCGVHESSPLDRAAFHGFDDVIELLLARDPDPPLHRTNEFGATPLGACLYGAVHGWRKDGDYPRAVELLLEAGARFRHDSHPVPEVDAVLARYPQQRDV